MILVRRWTGYWRIEAFGGIHLVGHANGHEVCSHNKVIIFICGRTAKEGRGWRHYNGMKVIWRMLEYSLVWLSYSADVVAIQCPS